MLSLLLWRSRHQIENRVNPTGGPKLNHIEFLFSHYDPQYWMFGIVDMLRRLAMTSSLVLFYHTDEQLMFGLIVAMTSMVFYKE